MFSTSRLLSVGIAAALLAACGGGSSGSNNAAHAGLAIAAAKRATCRC